LEENYLFPEIGKEIGVYLQKQLKEQKYDELSNPKLFAKQITSDLQQINHDKHLSLVFDPQRVKDLRIEGSQPSEEELREIEQRRIERRRRNNFGFRKVEILEGNVGCLDLRSFRSTDYAASTALGAMSFLSNSDAIIIDLRDNYGGGASMYLLLISYFFDSETVHLADLVNRRSNSIQQFWTLPYVPGKRLPDVDLFILTSKRTFSAAEEFTYDLQSLERAIVVGEATGGGAHLTTRLVVDDNFYIFIPFAGSRNLITNTNWEGVGIQPNIEVVEADALKTAYLLALKSLIKKTTDEEWKRNLKTLVAKIETEKN
jgi:C-terminal processing protease CtpA/Prc